ncbi:MAG: 16S rRNA (cytidine(1402)-2'-O)-methyltransferase [Simkaniaceae bacterium]
MLYLIPTPIGNLDDWTYRAVKTVQLCDYLLAEDTRRSKILLNHYDLHSKLISFHKFNEKQREESVIADLKGGATLGLISDGGTPLIQDPGASLVKRCREENISVSALPGPCALVTALTLIGGSEPFHFLGFLSKKESERKHSFITALLSQGLSLFYETPHQILKTLKELSEIDPNCRVWIARELTKKFEESLNGSSFELLHHFQNTAPKGEFVFIIEGQGPFPVDEDPKKLVQKIQNAFQLTQKEAIELAAKLMFKSKKILYREIHNLN